MCAPIPGHYAGQSITSPFGAIFQPLPVSGFGFVDVHHASFIACSTARKLPPLPQKPGQEGRFLWL